MAGSEYLARRRKDLYQLRLHVDGREGGEGLGDLWQIAFCDFERTVGGDSFWLRIIL